jgi:hypothetical protein
VACGGAQGNREAARNPDNARQEKLPSLPWSRNGSRVCDLLLLDTIHRAQRLSFYMDADLCIEAIIPRFLDGKPHHTNRCKAHRAMQLQRLNGQRTRFHAQAPEGSCSLLILREPEHEFTVHTCQARSKLKSNQIKASGWPEGFYETGTEVRCPPSRLSSLAKPRRAHHLVSMGYPGGYGKDPNPSPSRPTTKRMGSTGSRVYTTFARCEAVKRTS